MWLTNATWMQHLGDTIKFLESSKHYYLIIIGMDSKYAYVSPNYDHNFDFSNESLLGKSFDITVHPDDIEICRQVSYQCFQNPGQLFPGVLRKHNGKGGYVFTQWEFKALFDDDNNPEGIFCMGYNITEQMHTLTELVSAKTEIEDKTDKLNEIGFIQSHVIRKPLANVIGLSTVLSTMDLDGDSRTINNLLMKSANELDEVIKSIVDKTT